MKIKLFEQSYFQNFFLIFLGKKSNKKTQYFRMGITIKSIVNYTKSIINLYK